jgi:hypothetical protein
MRLSRIKVFSSVAQCLIWSVLAIHEWHKDPDGIFFWMTMVLVVSSVLILRLDVKLAGISRKECDTSPHDHRNVIYFLWG